MFHGDDGLDELTTTTTSDVWLIAGDVVATWLNPSTSGLMDAARDDLGSMLMRAHRRRRARRWPAASGGRCATSCC